MKQTEQIYSEPSTTSLRAHVWKLKTTRKIKHFIWQALSGCIATTSNLANRHCGNERSCPRCGADEESVNHLLFECPPARQVWALSSIPSHPGIFPCSSLYTNLDFLFWRARERGIQQEILSCFPWIIWYIWKARNEKVFNGEAISPLDTIQIATQEAESWRLAQIMVETGENLDEFPEPVHTDPGESMRNEMVCCSVDASWVRDAAVVGIGFVATLGSYSISVGLRAQPNNRSPLHAVLEGLIWAMHSMIRQGRLAVNFFSDCAQMIKLINEEDEWPSVAAELEELQSVKHLFERFSISYIPRTENAHADWLAKGARIRGFPFSYCGQLVPHWLGHCPNLFAPV